MIKTNAAPRRLRPPFRPGRSADDLQGLQGHDLGEPALQPTRHGGVDPEIVQVDDAGIPIVLELQQDGGRAPAVPKGPSEVADVQSLWNEVHLQADADDARIRGLRERRQPLDDEVLRFRYLRKCFTVR